MQYARKRGSFPSLPVAGDVGHLGWLFGEMPKTISILREEMASKKPDLLIYNHLMVNVGQLFWRQQKVRTACL